MLPKYCINRLAAYLIVISALLITGCHQDNLPDSELQKNFSENLQSFDEVSSKYISGQITCPYQQDPSICVIPNSQVIANHLHQKAHVQSIYLKKTIVGMPGLDAGLWLPVTTTGILGIRSSTRGYVYLNSPPKSLTLDTGSLVDTGTYYKQIQGNWYLYYVD